jgi:hypothetical protein
MFCDNEGLEFQPAALDQIYRDFYHGMGIPPRACHPRDIIGHVEDLAKYLEMRPTLSPDLVDMACRSYFLSKVEGH